MLHKTLFPSLPDHARLWVHAAEQPIPEDAKQAWLQRMDRFLTHWKSHGRPVGGGAAVLDDRFLVASGMLAEPGKISGCGIDALTRAIAEEADAHGITLASPLLIYWRNDHGVVASLSRGAFRRLVASGAIGPETSVFDLSLTTLGELRSGFEKPFRSAWHARVFRIPVAIP